MGARSWAEIYRPKIWGWLSRLADSLMPADRHSFVSFYPSDWLAGMGFMPPMLEWLYLQVCLYNWDKCAALPANEARMRFARSPEWEADLGALIDAGKVHRTASGAVFVERALIEAQRAYDLWERKSRGGKASKNQDDGDGRVKTVGKTVSKSAASNQSQTLSQISPNGDNPPTPQGGEDDADGFNGDLIFSVPPDIWRAFREHRIKLKAPMAGKAEALALKKLEQLWNQGHDPTAVIEQSMMEGWKGLFELKGNRNGAGNRGRSNGFQSAIDAARNS
jgi:hypothetical protein